MMNQPIPPLPSSPSPDDIPFEMRIVTEPQAVRPSSMAYARVPRDIVDITSGADIEKFAEMCASVQGLHAAGGAGSRGGEHESETPSH